ncbi:DUF7096 domain-containing protein [Haloplanus sp.]|uniref:DUF7096 domain-containing protein n=1 Tax=Haloplanus sp. TaxID=1961696 RepID=UPI003BB8DA18
MDVYMDTNGTVRRTAAVALLIVALVTVQPSAAVLATEREQTQDVPSRATVDVTAAEAAASDDTTNGSVDGSVNATVGQQLSTIIGASSSKVQTDYEESAFTATLADANATARADIMADRARELRTRSESILTEYRTVTAAYRAGNLTRSEYAQRLALLNVRASSVQNSYQRFERVSSNTSRFDLQTAGVNLTSLEATVERLDTVTGPGLNTLRSQYTGTSEGELELEIRDGLSIEAYNEDGERAREFERPRDGDNSVRISQADALRTARSALSAPDNTRWTLVESTVERGDGSYEFAFALGNTTAATGEAEVSVDASSGEVFELESEIERDDRPDTESDDARTAGFEDRELALVIADGTPAPGEEIVVRAAGGGDPVPNATVRLNERVVGETDEKGTVAVTLPADDDAELSARRGEAEGSLDIDLDVEEETRSVENVELDSQLDNETGTVTTTIAHAGEGVKDASVSVNGRQVAETGADGVATFVIDTAAVDEVELAVTKGEFELEETYGISDGSLVRADVLDEREEREEEQEEQEEEREEEEEQEEQEEEREEEEEEEQEEQEEE